jgi:hypothetical protein
MGIGARTGAMEVAAEQSLQWKRGAQQFLQTGGFGAHQRGVEAPSVLGAEIPIVQLQGKLKLRRRGAAPRSGASEAKAVGRVTHIPFDFVPVKAVVACVAAFDVAGESGTGNWSG